MDIWFLPYHNGEHYLSMLHLITFFIQCFILLQERHGIGAIWAVNIAPNHIISDISHTCGAVEHLPNIFTGSWQQHGKPLEILGCLIVCMS